MKRLMVAFVFVALILLVVPVSAQSVHGSLEELPAPTMIHKFPVVVREDGTAYQRLPYTTKYDQVEAIRTYSIRDLPTTDGSNTLLRATIGQTFRVYSKEGVWYKIGLGSGDFGYIREDGVKPLDEKDSETTWKEVEVRPPDKPSAWNTFIKKKMGVGPFPDLNFWVAILIGVVVLLLVIVGFRKIGEPPRRRR